jgi:hypothetical protein
MNNLQETLLFPVRDAEARKQFLFACLIVLAGYFIPLLPFLVVMGYTAKIMRQIIDEKKSPSMPAWQGSDWSEMLLEGLRLYGAQLVLMLPLFLFMGCGFISMFGGSMTMAISADEGVDALVPVGMLLFFIGTGFMMLIALLSLPYGIILSAVGPHVVTNRSFAAAFRFKEWWPIFRKGLGQFILGYVVIMVMSFVFALVIQIALITIVLMCIVPLIMIPYSAYLMLITNTFYAQAYAAGREALQIV